MVLKRVLAYISLRCSINNILIQENKKYSERAEDGRMNSIQVDIEFDIGRLRVLVYVFKLLTDTCL